MQLRSMYFAPSNLADKACRHQAQALHRTSADPLWGMAGHADALKWKDRRERKQCAEQAAGRRGHSSSTPDSPRGFTLNTPPIWQGLLPISTTSTGSLSPCMEGLAGVRSGMYNNMP